MMFDDLSLTGACLLPLGDQTGASAAEHLLHFPQEGQQRLRMPLRLRQSSLHKRSVDLRRRRTFSLVSQPVAMQAGCRDVALHVLAAILPCQQMFGGTAQRRRHARANAQVFQFVG